MIGGPVQTFHSAAPLEIRRQVCEDLLQAVRGETAFWYLAGLDGVITSTTTVGATDIADSVSAFEGHALPEGSAFEASGRAHRARRRGWEAAAIPQLLQSRFRALYEDFVSPQAFSELAVATRFYQPLGISDQLRMLPFAAGRSLGWIGVVRQDGRRFSAAQRRAADEHARSVTVGLAAARALESIGGEGALLIATADGRVEHACPRGAAWLTAQRADLMGQAVRLADGGGPDIYRIDHVLVRFVRLDGADGARYVATCSDDRLPRVSGTPSLTDMESAVARAAAAGLRVNEIAQDRGVSPNTIKHHLKMAYRKLHVTSRVELIQALASEPDGER